MKYVLFITLIIIASCASTPENVIPAYQDPVQYSDLSCAQLNKLHRSADQRRLAASKNQRYAHNSDIFWGAASAIVFGPAAILLINGNDETAYMLAKAKGEIEALNVAASRSDCVLI